MNLILADPTLKSYMGHSFEYAPRSATTRKPRAMESRRWRRALSRTR